MRQTQQCALLMPHWSALTFFCQIFVYHKLPMSQIVENRTEVRRIPVNEIRPCFILKHLIQSIHKSINKRSVLQILCAKQLLPHPVRDQIRIFLTKPEEKRIRITRKCCFCCQKICAPNI